MRLQRLVRMKTIATHVLRRTVVEAYLRYDAAKKSEPLPNSDVWDWTNPDAIDQGLTIAGYKSGILAGFLEWDQVELTVTDFRACAVVETISRSLNGPRNIEGLEKAQLLKDWTPRGGRATWSDNIDAGRPFTVDEPFILRPTVPSESPARWYLEDGSGRATAIVAAVDHYDKDAFVAYGFVGLRADPSSRFMKDHFPRFIR